MLPEECPHASRSPRVCLISREISSVIALWFFAISSFAVAAEPRAPSDSSNRRLESQLAAGEFGPALDAASRVQDPAERARQLREIAGAQRQHREFRGALETASRIPAREERARERTTTVRDRGQNGGGSQADFTELIDLVTSTINPESWDEVGGPGSVRENNRGVLVDPKGVLRQQTKVEQQGRLAGLSRRARVADLNDDLAQPAALRMVSLKRLEQAVAARLASGEPIPETLRHLAGLTQIRYVFIDPADRELVIAGPAEGWRYDDQGLAVGRESGRPMLELDDLVVLLRTYAPGAEARFGCSINTRDENLKQLKEFVEASQRTGPLRPGQVGRWVNELQKRLGLQDIVVHGVPAETRVAQVLVEADYKMKLIGVEKLDGGPGIPGYFTLLRQAGNVGGAPLEALRWWLTMKYDAILHSPDRTTFELQGSSVLVQSENQFINAQGQNLPTGISEPINRLFAENFTRNYAELAAREPVFADLQNVFDMALVAALCRQERLHDRVDWNLGVFAPDGAYRPAVVPAPQVIESVVNHRVYGGKEIVVQVAGGVQANLMEVARDKKLAQESAKLGNLSRATAFPKERWWWDARN